MKTDEKQRWLFASTLLNAFLATAKLIWGLVFGSTLVMADGIHSMSDVFGALLIFLALRFAGHVSARFPYGLHKLEDMAAVLGGLGILFAGYEIVHSVFFVGDVQAPQQMWSTIGFIVIIGLIQMVFYYFELKAAKRMRSPGVEADAVNWLGDIGAGFVVVIGLIANHYGVAYAQEITVIIIVTMIIKGAYDVMKEGLFSLLDASMEPEVVQEIEKIVAAFSQVTQIKHLAVRRAGSVLFANIELSIDEINMTRAHETIDEIVQALHSGIDNLELATVHYGPSHPPTVKVVTLLSEDRHRWSESFGKAAYLKTTVFDKDNRVLSEEIIPNPLGTQEKGKALKLVAWMIRQRVDRIIMSPAKIDEDVLSLFDAVGIELKTRQ